MLPGRWERSCIICRRWTSSHIHKYLNYSSVDAGCFSPTMKLLIYLETSLAGCRESFRFPSNFQHGFSTIEDRDHDCLSVSTWSSQNSGLVRKGYWLSIPVFPFLILLHRVVLVFVQSQLQLICKLYRSAPQRTMTLSTRDLCLFNAFFNVESKHSANLTSSFHFFRRFKSTSYIYLRHF